MADRGSEWKEKNDAVTHPTARFRDLLSFVEVNEGKMGEGGQPMQPPSQQSAEGGSRAGTISFQLQRWRVAGNRRERGMALLSGYRGKMAVPGCGRKDNLVLKRPSSCCSIEGGIVFGKQWL